MDIISRDALINKLNSIPYLQEHQNLLCLFIEWVKDQPTAYDSEETDVIGLVESQPKVGEWMPVSDAVDKLFSHNEIIGLWRKDENDKNSKVRFWRGMAWNIPDEYKNCLIERFFGIVPYEFEECDTVNILVVEPYKEGDES